MGATDRDNCRVKVMRDHNKNNSHTRMVVGKSDMVAEQTLTLEISHRAFPNPGQLFSLGVKNTDVMYFMIATNSDFGVTYIWLNIPCLTATLKDAMSTVFYKDELMHDI